MMLQRRSYFSNPKMNVFQYLQLSRKILPATSLTGMENLHMMKRKWGLLWMEAAVAPMLKRMKCELISQVVCGIFGSLL